MKPFINFMTLISICSLSIFLACEDIELGEGTQAENVQGFWQLGTSNSYLLVSNEEVIFYSFNASKNCTTSDIYQVVRIDGTGFYILTKEGLEENLVLALTFDGELLAVRDINETHREIKWYQPSELDITTFEQECVSETDVFGEWESTLDNQSTIYLSITPDTITVIDQNTNLLCYFINNHKVISIDENTFTIEEKNTNSETLTQNINLIRLNKDLLQVERFENGNPIVEIFVKSESDFSTLEPICENVNPFLGLYHLQDNSEVSSNQFLSIENETVNFYKEVSGIGCYEKDVFNIASLSNDRMTLVSEDNSRMLDFLIYYENGSLIIEYQSNGSEVYSLATTTTDEIEDSLCDFGDTSQLSGTWQFKASSDDDRIIYLVISESRYTFHSQVGDIVNDPDNSCFVIDRYDIVLINGFRVLLKQTYEPFSEYEYLVRYNEKNEILYVDNQDIVMPYFSNVISDDIINKSCATSDI